MYNKEYESIKIKNKTALILEGNLNELFSIKQIVFDCDGVIIDIKNSFDLSIIKTIDYIFKPVANGTLVDTREIEELRYTGLYNNEWDTVYALAIFTFSELTKKSAENVLTWLKNGKVTDVKEIIEKEILKTRFSDFIRFLKQDPLKDAEEYARLACKKNKTKKEFNAFIHSLGKPTKPSNSFIVKLFDSKYYGNELYKKVYGSESLFKEEPGYISNEKTLVKEDSLVKLKKFIEKPFLMLTGRSRIGAEHVLGPLTKYFDLDSSVFIEDMMRINSKKAIGMKKPSPLPLLDLVKTLETLYVGDSVEDILLAKSAKKKFPRIFFAGITGCKENPSLAEKFFMEQGADVIVKSVRDLVEIFENAVFGDRK